MKQSADAELIGLYFRFQSLLAGLKNQPQSETLSPDLEALLAVVSESANQDQPMAVRKLLVREELGSPATIHKRIHLLRKAGLVDFKGVEADSRVKLVVPTEEALRFFSEYGRILKEANKPV
jgi:DNA-binding MarR family transcriptional regulator